MATDATLMAILLGGVWTPSGYILPPAIVVGHTVGIEGIDRTTTPAAFSGGYLRPCALVRQWGNVPTGDVVDYEAQLASARQRVQIYIYQDAPGYTAIDAAKARLYTLFQGHRFSDTFEVRLANDLDRVRDTGSLAGASMRVLDWQVDSILGG